MSINNLKQITGIKFQETAKNMVGIDVKDVIHSPAKESSKIQRIKNLKNKKAEHEQVSAEYKNTKDKLSREYDS